MKLGCIGDDFTGSSDLANTLTKEGMRVVQYAGLPTDTAREDIDAGVISLKTRSVPVAEAVAQSLAALEWLQAQGCQQILFKYCSTFDSTKDGNIGPVLDALADALDADRVIVCPAFPGTGRTIYQGHLFVNDVLLNECGMQDHPLTPMTDADIRRWLAYQARSSVGHVAIKDVTPDSFAVAMEREHEHGNRLIVIDAVSDQDLRIIGQGAAKFPLISGGSGIALGLPKNFGISPQTANAWVGTSGKIAALSGSCSVATRGQVARHSQSHPTLTITASDVMGGKITPTDALDFVMISDGIPLVTSSADPTVLKDSQSQFGTDDLANAIEAFFCTLAQKLVEHGIGGIISAGGETSGAVVQGTQTRHLEIGPEIDPGVPVVRSDANLVLALKSGNFGGEDFFAKAASMMSQR